MAHIYCYVTKNSNKIGKINNNDRRRNGRKKEMHCEISPRI